MRKLIIAGLIFFIIFTGCSTRNESTLKGEQAGGSLGNTNPPERVLEEATTEPNADTEIMDYDFTKGEGDTIEISEKMFLTQINDMYYNFEDYKDKTIRVQGMYDIETSEIDGSTMHMVYRNGPGCCGNDGWGGFYLHYDGVYPEQNAWVEVIGTPELVEDEEYMLLYLNVTSIQVMEERGEEFVYQ